MVTKQSSIEERVLHVAEYACYQGSVRYWRFDTTDRAISDGWCADNEADLFEEIAQKLKKDLKR